ncbi:MAG: hypothetical protein OXC80_01305 [Gammaproteobacteria bacterium]|nr:hypothetical protein [Gammaproteobacteria bacterium]
MNGIGQLNEGELHRALKRMYTTENSDTEVSIDGYVVDVLYGDQIYEVQTANFSAMKKKLYALLPNYRITLVYPIARLLTIVKKHPDGTETRRKSPKKANLAEVFSELVFIPKLLEHPNFTLEVVYIHEEQERVTQRRLRKRWSREARRLVEVLQTQRFRDMRQLFSEIAGDLPDLFSTKDLAVALGTTVHVGRKVAYCFRESDVIHVCRKQRNLPLYCLTE